MKNLKYILVPALAGIMFASCNDTPQGPTQAELDAKVETKVKEATDKMKADCDAQIMGAAQIKKDSILIKMGKMTAPPATKPVTKTTTTKTTTTTTKTEPVKEEPVKTNPSNTTRPGSNQGTQVPANNKTRPGSNEGMQQQQKTETKPSNNTRPGAKKE